MSSGASLDIRKMSAYALVAASLLWYRLSLPLALDELSSVWVVSGSFSETIGRALHVQGQSALYYLLLWPFFKLAPESSLILRLPSLIFYLCSAWLMFRITSRLWSEWSGVVAAAIILCSSDVIRAATEARPYALAIMLSIAATLALLQWIKRAEPRWGILYGGMLAAVFYAHYIYLNVAIAHFLLALWLVPKEGKTVRFIKQAPLAGLTFLAVAAPSISHIRDLANKSGAISFAKMPTFMDLCFALPTAEIVFCLLAVVLVIFILKRNQIEKLAVDRRALGAALGMLIVPVLSIYLVSVITDRSIFIERYFGARVIGGSIAGMMLLNAVRDFKMQKLILIGLVMTAILGNSKLNLSPMHEERWGEALGLVESEVGGKDCPVFYFSGFVENQNVDWFSDPIWRSFIKQPLSYYRFNLPVQLIPYTFDLPDAARYRSTALDPIIERADCAAIIYRNGEMYFGNQRHDPAPLALEQEILPKAGMTLVKRETFGTIEARYFERTSQDDSARL